MASISLRLLLIYLLQGCRNSLLADTFTNSSWSKFREPRIRRWNLEAICQSSRCDHFRFRRPRLASLFPVVGRCHNHWPALYTNFSSSQTPDFISVCICNMFIDKSISGFVGYLRSAVDGAMACEYFHKSRCGWNPDLSFEFRRYRSYFRRYKYLRVKRWQSRMYNY